MSKRKNHLIFGGSGFIGHHTINKVKSLGEKYQNFDIVQPYEQIGSFENLDIRDPKFVDNFKASQEDIIVNLAAVHRTPGHKPHEYFETNIKGAENICDFARKHNIKTIVFTSSIAPYGTYEEQKSEKTIPMPDIPYGISKLNAEYIHKLWQAEDPKHRKLIILRPGVVFGKHEKGNFTRLINSMVKGQFIYPGRKDTIKACIYVKDLVEIMFQMINKLGNGVHTYNFTYEPAPTIEYLCNVIAESGNTSKPKFTLPPKILFLASFFLHRVLGKVSFHKNRIKKLMISNNISGKRISNEFNFKYGLEEGIKDWMKETGFHKTNKIH